MKRDDDMHRSLFSDLLSRNSTEDLHEYSLKFREMKPAELLEKAKIWLNTEFAMTFRKSESPNQVEDKFLSLVEKLKGMIESEGEIPPDFLAGLYSTLVDFRTCSCCGPMSKENEALLMTKIRKAEKLLK